MKNTPDTVDSTSAPELGRRGLLMHSSVYLISNVLAAAVPFLMMPILTRALTLSQYGQVAMFQTFLAILAGIVGVNTAGAANRKFYDGNEDESILPEYIAACLTIGLTSAVVVGVLASVFAHQIEAALNLNAEFIVAGIIAALMVFIFNIRLGQWQVRKKAAKYGKFLVSQTLLNMLLSVWFVVVLHQGAEGRIYGQTIAISGFAVVALISLQKERLIRFPTNWVSIREALRFGVPLIPHVAAVFFLKAFDRVAINSSLGLDQTAIYVVAAQIAMVIGIIADAFNKAFVPWLFDRLKRDNLVEKIQIIKLTYIYVVIALLAGCSMLVIGPHLVTLIAGEKYKEAGAIIGIIGIGQAFHGMYLMVTNYIIYARKTALLSLTSMLSAAIHVVLLFILIGNLGIKGAALAFAISMMLRFFMTLVAAQRVQPMPWLYFLPANR